MSYVNKENFDRSTPSNSPKALAPNSHSGQRVHRVVSSKNVRFMSVVFAHRNSRKDHMRRPCTKKDAPARIRTKLLFSSGELVAMPAPTSKRPEEREFVVDSGASMHRMSKKELSSEKEDTVKSSRTPTVALTADGECTPTRRHKCSFMI